MGEPQSGRAHLAYRPELDGIRAFAVLAVMVYHGVRLAPVGRPSSEGFFYQGGFLGVDVFFVLSGYLITTLLVREWGANGRVRIGNFYARRALRLLPALFMAIVLGGVVVKVISHPFARPYRQSAVLAIAYVANWFQIKRTLAPLGHVWSLSIEEQYYIVWPALLIVGLKVVRSRRTLALLAFAAAAAMSVARYVAYARGNAPFAALSTFTRPDGILIGSGLALLLDDAPRRLRDLFARRELAIAACVVVAIASVKLAWTSRLLYLGGLTVVNLCTAFVVAHLTTAPGSLLARGLAARPLPQIGRISYGLYLYHVPIVYLVTEKEHSLARSALFFAMTFVAAIASYVLVERPILGLKRRFGSVSDRPRAVTA